MKETIIEKTIDVQLTIKTVKYNNKEYKDLTITFNNGFTLKVSPTFDLTSKQWGKLQATLREEMEGNK